ncbi:MAG: hypothetical protein AAF696_35895 [Bacteroidota bacterium]
MNIKDKMALRKKKLKSLPKEDLDFLLDLSQEVKAIGEQREADKPKKRKEKV